MNSFNVIFNGFLRVRPFDTSDVADYSGTAHDVLHINKSGPWACRRAALQASQGPHWSLLSSEDRRYRRVRFGNCFCLTFFCLDVSSSSTQVKKKQKIKARDGTLVSPFPHLLSFCFVGDLSASSKTTMLNSVWKPEHPSARERFLLVRPFDMSVYVGLLRDRTRCIAYKLKRSLSLSKGRFTS